MILFNKLVWTDLLLMVALVLLFVVGVGEKWRSVMQAFTIAMLLISIINHVDHYRKTKKLY